ncbi:hypothetical protein CANCADRAFT_3003 [Tortispora caseinolytica NRRL Y-17796]|uniref:Sas10 C-terminal domain-containing protein n=1 Tax=Tortispora caseinolytica NRRL Y-17796 TaxID=767744 RepID=A0A1E4THR0_9ASCO|nr:hypothetical protein CANCADRAFT_3003 [Tortispora caseinolytica NRRL Y-17796]
MADENWIDDEVDSFHRQDDQILLNTAPVYKDDERLDDDEVLGLPVAGSDESDVSESEISDASDASEVSDASKASSEEKPRKKIQKSVLDDIDVDHWGASKSSYYDADEVDSESDAELEEQTALKLRRQQLSELNEDDFYDGEFNVEDAAPAAFTAETSSAAAKETKFLVRDFKRLTPLLKQLTATEPESDKCKALTLYMGTVTTYFLLISENPLRNLKSHPIMDALVQCRRLFSFYDSMMEQETVEESKNDMLVEAADESEEIEEEISEEIEEELSEEIEEYSESMEDSDVPEEFIDDTAQKKKAKKITVASLGNDYGDDEDVDEEEKQKRKRSLRFYTSKISQRERRTDALVHGDDDVPYAERDNRSDRLNELAQQRGVDPVSEREALGGDNSDEEMADESQQGKQKLRKQRRKEAHEAALLAARDGKLGELAQTVGEDGKRAIDYQILKNKGLTPKRKKENRNSRVKKRVQYNKAQKRLRSQQQVYKTPETAYQGELTGIKKNISRATKFRD